MPTVPRGPAPTTPGARPPPGGSPDLQAGFAEVMERVGMHPRQERMLARAQQNWCLDWAAPGRCRIEMAEVMFADRAEDQRRAKALCRECPVAARCLAEALDDKDSRGVWGGLNQRERAALRRRYPGVTSWTDWMRAQTRPG